MTVTCIPISTFDSHTTPTFCKLFPFPKVPKHIEFVSNLISALKSIFNCVFRQSLSSSSSRRPLFNNVVINEYVQFRLLVHKLTVGYIVDSLKELGNREFRRQNYREAIRVSLVIFSFKSHIVFNIGHKLYTQALDSVEVRIPIETRRILFANRAQAFVSYAVIHEALRDVNHALSPEYTNQNSPKTLTAKCRFRRAKLLCTMARYDEAQADYSEFANIMKEIGKEITGEELKFKEDLDRKAAAGSDSEQRRRDELMRAIDVSTASMQLVNA